MPLLILVVVDLLLLFLSLVDLEVAQRYRRGNFMEEEAALLAADEDTVVEINSSLSSFDNAFGDAGMVSIAYSGMKLCVRVLQ